MRDPRFIFLLILYVLLPLMPLFLFFQATDGTISLFIRISRTAGIYAFVWYALQFIVTARIRLLEWFLSQDRRLILHMATAVGVLLVVVVHTSFGNEKYLSKLQAGLGGTAETIFLWATLFSGLFFSNYFIRFLPFLMPYRDKIATLFKLTHERYLLLHYAMPVGMVLLIAHVMLVPGRGLIAFKTCMALIGGCALGVFLVHKFLIPLMMKRHPWKVYKVIQESDSVVTVCFTPPSGRKIKHQAGQYCFLRPFSKDIPSQSHPFTISSGPGENRLCITVKQLGDFTSRMNMITPGTSACIDGAYGKFSHDRIPPERHLVFIAGGIGITPMLSMLRDLSIKNPKRKVLLIWGARYETDLIRKDEIQAMQNQMPGFIFEPVLSQEPAWNGSKGRIDNSMLTRILNRNGLDTASQSLSRCDFFVCGPAAMTADILKLLRKKKIPNQAIHTERFAF